MPCFISNTILPKPNLQINNLIKSLNCFICNCLPISEKSHLKMLKNSIYVVPFNRDFLNQSNNHEHTENHKPAPLPAGFIPRYASNVKMRLRRQRFAQHFFCGFKFLRAGLLRNIRANPALRSLLSACICASRAFASSQSACAYSASWQRVRKTFANRKRSLTSSC